MNERIASDQDELAGLLEATSRGDRAAFRRLYETTGPKLFGIVLRITGSRPMAEDVLQEAYMKVWQNAGRFDTDAGRAMSWLATIARNGAIDRIRSERVVPRQTEDGAEILDRLAAPSTGDPIARETLSTCLSALDPDARSCVVLAYCTGLSREELAERFNRPVGTIKTLLHRSIRALKACMER